MSKSMFRPRLIFTAYALTLLVARSSRFSLPASLLALPTSPFVCRARIPSSMAAVTSRIIPWRFRASTTNQPSNRARGISIFFRSYGVLRVDPHSKCWLSVPETKTCRLVYASATSSEASILEPKMESSPQEDAEIVVISRDEDKITLGVHVPGMKTQSIYDDVFNRLADAAQPVPGFRRVKGGKTPDVPKEVFLHIIGPSKLKKQSIKKIINSVMAEYVKKEGLSVCKDLKVEESYEELEVSFEPGESLSFTAVIRLKDT